jgi:hypothetical protein
MSLNFPQHIHWHQSPNHSASKHQPAATSKAAETSVKVTRPYPQRIIATTLTTAEWFLSPADCRLVEGQILFKDETDCFVSTERSRTPLRTDVTIKRHQTSSTGVRTSHNDERRRRRSRRTRLLTDTPTTALHRARKKPEFHRKLLNSYTNQKISPRLACRKHDSNILESFRENKENTINK